MGGHTNYIIIYIFLSNEKHVISGLAEGGLTLYHTFKTFNDPEKEAFLKTLWEKEKMLVTSIFSFSHNVFYPSQKEFLYLSYIYCVVCKCFQFGPV